MLVVFASNMDPGSWWTLVSCAGFKQDQDRHGLGRTVLRDFSPRCRENQVAFDPGIPKDLIDFIRGTLKQELRQCYPGIL